MRSELPLVRHGDFAGYQSICVRLLGRGGMASIVYQAENPRLRNLIALKVLAPELADDQVFRTRFPARNRRSRPRSTTRTSSPFTVNGFRGERRTALHSDALCFPAPTCGT